MGGEGDFLFLLGDLDHHGLKNPLVPAIDGQDLAAGGRGVIEIYFADEVDEHGQRIHRRRD